MEIKKLVLAVSEILKASVKDLNAAIIHIKENWSDYSGGWLDINKPEIEKQIREELTDIHEKPIFRAIRLDDFMDFDANDIGIYWTYSKDKAKAYWGSGRVLVVLTAKVKEDDIDWIETVECHLKIKTSGEDEVRLKKTARPKVVKIEKHTVK